MHFITLTTDFGLQDWFVGTMKGVILGIQPSTVITDLTHHVPAGDIRGGAFALAAGYRFFPKGTIHVVVVDPGVGGTRKAIAVQTASYRFVAPDNGVLSFALANETIQTIHRLETEKFFLHPLSRTFHGRDIFAPVAAHWSRGISIRKLGSAQKDFIHLPSPKPQTRRGALEGEIAYIDRFGNAITNIATEDLPEFGNPSCRVYAGRKPLCLMASFYDAVPRGRPVAVFGSTGYLEIAVNGGSAARKFRLRIGQAVSVRV